VLGAGNKPGLLDELCVRTQCDVFHTETVCTIIAQSSSRLIVVI
jgi:hypothetical protein